MKIGILTFHHAHNYGAVLQAYALQEFLKSLGNDVEIINYKPQYLLQAHSIFEYNHFKKSSLKGRIKYLVFFPFIFRRRCLRFKRFNQFIHSELTLSTREYDQSNSISAEYDAYIFGSDQIWNPQITNGYDPVFFGQFKIKYGSKRIAYAASMEDTKLSEDAQIYFHNAFKIFDSLSIRESVLCNYLQPLSTQKIHTVLDPSLLVNKTIFDKISVKPNVIEKYILVYQVRESKAALRIANDVARQRGAIVVQLTCKVFPGYVKNRFQCASVEEFIGWFKYADCVITTSFHGTAFSIIYNKPFYTIKFGSSTDNRSIGLLKPLDLLDRLVSEESSPVFADINYVDVNKTLDVFKRESSSYLENALM